MAMLAEQVDAVLGADTHRDTHTLELLSPVGASIATTTVDSSPAGHRQALGWIRAHAPGPRVVAGVEGTRNYGAGLARAFLEDGITVVEVEQPSKRDRRRGKSDTIDAHLAARQVLGLDPDRMGLPRADGDREALRILLAARRDLATSKTRAINQLRALLITGDDADRALNPRGSRFTLELLASIARRRGVRDETREQAVRRNEARRLAQRIRDLDVELTTNKTQLVEIVNDLAPGLLDRRGVGPVSAAQVLVSWSHHGRCRNDAAFAALAGASPLEASSGQHQHHRLNRGGDRALNRALHQIMLTRWRSCPRTHSYIERRRAEGRSDRSIRRILKRYLARELHRALTANAALPQPT